METTKVISPPKSILIPTDFSKCALNACEYASSLFTESGTVFKLIHTFDSSGKSAEDYSKRHDTHLGLLQNECDRMEECLTENVQVQKVLVHGDIAYLPEEIVRENDIDLIVMGSEGSTKEESHDTPILGDGYTHTSKLMSRIDQNFLIIPSDAKFAGIKTVLIATDLHTSLDEDHIQLFNWLNVSFNPKIHYGYVSRDIMSADKTQENYIQSLNKKLDVKAASYHEIKEENIVTGLRKLSNSIEADLIIAVSRHKNFIDRLTRHSYTKDMAEKLNKPLLILTK